MAEDLGSAVLTLNANPAPLTGAMATAKAKTIATARGTGVASAAAFAAGLATLGVAAGVGLYKIGQQFEAAYNTIRDGTGATGEDLESLKDSFRKAFAAAPADAETTADAIADLNTRLGLTGDELTDRAEQFLKLSDLTGGDVTKSIEVVSHAFENWQVATEDQEGYLDGLYRVAQATGIEVDDLAQQLTDSGPVLRQFGFGFEEGAALMGEAHKAGLDLQSGLKRAFAGLTDPSSKLEEDFKKLGIGLDDPKTAFMQFIEAMEGADDPMEHAGTALELFGKRSGMDMVEAVASGKFSLEEMTGIFKDGGDTITGVYKETETFTDKLERLKAKGMLALEKPAMMVIDAVNAIADGLLWVTETVEALPGPVKTVAGVVAIFVGALLGIAGALKVVKGMFGIMRALMLTNPWVLAIGGIIVLVVLVVKYWDKIKEYISKAWNWIKDVTSQVWEAIVGFLKDNWQIIIAIFTGPLGLIVGLIVKHWKKIKNLFGKIAGTMKELAEKAVQAVVSSWDWLKRKVGAVFSWLGRQPGNFFNRVKNGFDRIVNFIASVPGRIARVAKGMFNGIWEAFKAAINFIIGGWNSLEFTMPKLNLGPLGSVGGWTIGVPDIPYLATGGTATDSGLAMVGEAGPELLHLPRGASVVPLDRAVGRQEAPVVNVNFANGMEWLRDFVQIEIDRDNRGAGLAYSAGSGGLV